MTGGDYGKTNFIKFRSDVILPLFQRGGSYRPSERREVESCLSLCAEKRPRGTAAHGPLPHFLPFSPAPPSPTPAPGPDRRPYKITPSLTRTRTRNAIFLNHHFRVKGVLPESQLPPLPSPGRPFAGGCQTAVAQAHQRPRRARRALSPLCTRLPGPALPRRAPPALSRLLQTRHRGLSPP